MIPRCPACGEDLTDFLGDEYLKVERSGVQPSSPSGPAVHWFVGVLTCAFCGHEMDYGDSD